ncbi:hypothetical protein HaLaN_00785, partial [Haematococcus lacustris]
IPSHACGCTSLHLDCGGGPLEVAAAPVPGCVWLPPLQGLWRSTGAVAFWMRVLASGCLTEAVAVVAVAAAAAGDDGGQGDTAGALPGLRGLGP